MRRKAPLSILATTAPAESGCISETAVALAICYRSKSASSFLLRAIKRVTNATCGRWYHEVDWDKASKESWFEIPRPSHSSITVYCSYTRLSWADLKKAERHNTCIIQFIPFLTSNRPLATVLSSTNHFSLQLSPLLIFSSCPQIWVHPQLVWRVSGPVRLLGPLGLAQQERRNQANC